MLELLYEPRVKLDVCVTPHAGQFATHSGTVTELTSYQRQYVPTWFVYKYTLDFLRDELYSCQPDVYLCKCRIQLIINHWCGTNVLVNA